MHSRPLFTRPRLHQLWDEWHGLLLFLVVMLLFRSAVADWNQVPTGSMKPTILEGDRVVVNKLAYNLKLPFTTVHLAEWAEPRHGDIVTFYSPLDERLLIKRVIGLPGDIVAMRDNHLYVNGEEAHYTRADTSQFHDLAPYQTRENRVLLEQIDHRTHPIMVKRGRANGYSSFGPVQVPEGHYLMLGDNRDRSGDSRIIGFVAEKRITGRAHTIAFSVDYDDFYLPRIDRFIKPLD